MFFGAMYIKSVQHKVVFTLLSAHVRNFYGVLEGCVISYGAKDRHNYTVSRGMGVFIDEGKSMCDLEMWVKWGH